VLKCGYILLQNSGQLLSWLDGKAKGQFDRSEFHYIAEDDELECPAGERLIYRFTRMENGKETRRYWSSACPNCPIHAQCTTGKNRRVSRWVHEVVVERAAARLAAKPDAMGSVE
jgi:hypothetical protein